ncbi:antifungal protein ginkbilobin-like protein [Rhodamnia argentea]|uniref:Antifungal protein ginkbilobin-like protein n=1 Tax=Rhodamnia argentea TaxID=178133 RepID=A0ABM3HGA4_9MYRT|nr:antifungal protein ginkbilobin-like protein [Rhodamnia argentea]
MASFHKTATIIIVVLCSCNVLKGDPDETVVSKICNGDTGTTWSYNDLVNDLLQDLVDHTPGSGFNYYKEKDEFLTNSCYGHGACNGLLTPPDCHKCLGDAKELIQKDCHFSVGAQVQLQDCRIRSCSLSNFRRVEKSAKRLCIR